VIGTPGRDIRVRIVVKGRIGPALQSALADLHPGASPRHSRVTVRRGDLASLMAVLDSLSRNGVEVERVVGPRVVHVA
jgi:hypothetical protein